MNQGLSKISSDKSKFLTSSPMKARAPASGASSPDWLAVSGARRGFWLDDLLDHQNVIVMLAFDLPRCRFGHALKLPKRLTGSEFGNYATFAFPGFKGHMSELIFSQLFEASSKNVAEKCWVNL